MTICRHVEHFVCAQCEKPFLGQKHYEKNGLAYCETHYNQLFGDVCYHCNEVIDGDGKFDCHLHSLCICFKGQNLSAFCYYVTENVFPANVMIKIFNCALFVNVVNAMKFSAMQSSLIVIFIITVYVFFLL